MTAPRPRKAAPPPPLGERELVTRILERHPRPEWATFSQVRNAAGFSATRTLDAIAINTWPSRGLEVHGFECKSSRGDWLREKDDPEKAEVFVQFCDRWWLVAGRDDLVHPGELPVGWGLLVPRGAGLVAKVEAPKLEPRPLDRQLLAVLLRRAAEPSEDDKEALRRAEARGRKEGLESAKASADHLEREVKRLEGVIATFEQASGVRLNHWEAGNIGKAVAFVREGGVAYHERRLRDLAGVADKVAAAAREALAGLPEERPAGAVLDAAPPL